MNAHSFGEFIVHLLVFCIKWAAVGFIISLFF